MSSHYKEKSNLPKDGKARAKAKGRHLQGRASNSAQLEQRGRATMELKRWVEARSGWALNAIQESWTSSARKREPQKVLTRQGHNQTCPQRGPLAVAWRMY